MKPKLHVLEIAVSLLLLSSCSDEGNPEGVFVEPQTYDVMGKVEKGPFVSGSTITIQPMNAKLQVLGDMYSATIQDNIGNFSFGPKLFDAPYAELMANGYFFNEVKGELSSGVLNLRALVDLSESSTVNVNILTHLKYQRLQKLIAGGMKFAEANKQAQRELFTAFGLQKYADKDVSSFSIAGGTDESAALIAISSLLLVDRSEAALTEYMARLCKEFAQDGTFLESTKTQMEKDKEVVASLLPSIKKNIIERYQDLGLDVEVKDLAYFFDWDNDGTAGNETLQDGQEITMETTDLKVPNEGGTYAIRITSPVPVYLKPQVAKEEIPNISVTEENFFSNMYDGVVEANISLETNLEDNVLTIKVASLHSRVSQTTSIRLYDYLGNVLGEVTVSQDGNGDLSVPKLGEAGQQVVSSFALRLAQAFSDLNLIEQYYHYNKETGLVNQYILENSGTISDIWSALYNANAINLNFKDAESRQLGVYQPYFNLFSAMYYYYMVVAWGDMPYIDKWTPDSENRYVGRTPQAEILGNISACLKEAMSDLEEKKNAPLTDINGFFFMSKDVARILLANICMYQGDYYQAETLLAEVVANGFYELDASNYNLQETITGLWENGGGKEIIFATLSEAIPRSGVVIEIGRPLLVPVMNYTDVLLSYAESLYKNGKVSQARTQLEKVTTVKGIYVTGADVLDEIKDARLQLTLYCNTNFAFMKRNGFAQDVYGIEAHNLLLPIPRNELNTNPMLIQNPGY